MNIGIVTTWFERGAAYVSRQYKQLLERDHSVFIFVRSGDYATIDANWAQKNVTWSKGLPFVGMTAFDLGEFRTWLKNHSIDLVLFNEQHWWPPILLCNELGIISGAYVDYYTEETVPLFGCYDFLICNTKRHYSVFDWHPQCLYLPWGTDINLFNPKSETNLADNIVTFFHSTGLSPIRKGTDLILEAFSALSSPARLVIHSQGPLAERIPNQATLKKLIEDGRLTLNEQTVTAPGLYHLGDVYVYPSRLEGIGLTIAEALACGLPVITTDNPPMNEFVNHNLTGRLASVSRHIARSDGYYWPQSIVDLGSLIEQMTFYVEQADNLPTFKQQAREYAVHYLDWGKNYATLTSFMSRVKRLAPEVKHSAIMHATEFEERRTTLPQRYPKAFLFMSRTYRLMKRLRAQTASRGITTPGTQA